MKIYSQFLLSTLFELSDKVQRKLVIYSRMKSTKEVKIRSVIEEYVNKYLSQLSIKKEVIESIKPD